MKNCIGLAVYIYFKGSRKDLDKCMNMESRLPIVCSFRIRIHTLFQDGFHVFSRILPDVRFKSILIPIQLNSL